MRRWMLTAGLVLACTELTGDFGDVVAIRLLSPRSVTLEEGEAVTLEAQALDAAGDVVTGSGIVWELVVVDTGTVGIDLDPETGLVTANAPGTWQVRARVDALRTEPVSVRVTGAPDLVRPAGDTVLTVAAGATQSASLLVAVLDLTSAPGDTTGLQGTSVTYEVTDAFPGSATDGVAVGTVADTLAVTVSTATDGTAATVVRRVGATQPDSTLVAARVLTALGDTVPGSPVRFLVIFENP